MKTNFRWEIIISAIIIGVVIIGYGFLDYQKKQAEIEYKREEIRLKVEQEKTKVEYEQKKDQLELQEKEKARETQEKEKTTQALSLQSCLKRVSDYWDTYWNSLCEQIGKESKCDLPISLANEVEKDYDRKVDNCKELYSSN